MENFETIWTIWGTYLFKWDPTGSFWDPTTSSTRPLRDPLGQFDYSLGPLWYQLGPFDDTLGPFGDPLDSPQNTTTTRAPLAVLINADSGHF